MSYCLIEFQSPNSLFLIIIILRTLNSLTVYSLTKTILLNLLLSIQIFVSTVGILRGKRPKSLKAQSLTSKKPKKKKNQSGKTGRVHTQSRKTQPPFTTAVTSPASVVISQGPNYIGPHLPEFSYYGPSHSSSSRLFS